MKEVYPLVFVSIEKIYQTLKAVFHRLSEHLEFRQKCSPSLHIVFSTLFSVFGYPIETLSLVFDIMYYWNNSILINDMKENVTRNILRITKLHVTSFGLKGLMKERKN